MPSAALASSPLPFVVLMLAGFIIGAAGHLYRSNVAVGTGIALIFFATLLLPILLYVSGER